MISSLHKTFAHKIKHLYLHYLIYITDKIMIKLVEYIINNNKIELKLKQFQKQISDFGHDIPNIVGIYIYK